MGDHEDGHALGVEAVEHLQDGLACGGVEVAGGLVGHEDDGLGDERAGDGDALLLTTGELARAMAEAVAEANHAEHGGGAGDAVALGDALIEVGLAVVLFDGECGDEVEGLEDEADLAAPVSGEFFVGHLRDVAAVEEILAGGGAVEAAQDVHERALARAAGAHDGNVVTELDGGLDALEGFDHDGAVGLEVGLADAAEFDDGVGHDGVWMGDDQPPRSASSI